MLEVNPGPLASCNMLTTKSLRRSLVTTLIKVVKKIGINGARAAMLRAQAGAIRTLFCYTNPV